MPTSIRSRLNPIYIENNQKSRLAIMENFNSDAYSLQFSRLILKHAAVIGIHRKNSPKLDYLIITLSKAYLPTE